jgi:TetR/AcrR family macrolide resistance operon transcriptional repressor
MPRPKLKSDDEVLEAATAVLKRCGPVNFTLSEVANEVGLSRAALIQRFTNRDTLLVRMMERSVGQVRVHLDAMPAGRRAARALGVLAGARSEHECPQRLLGELSHLLV